MVVITLNSITTLKKNNEETPPTLNLGLTTLNRRGFSILYFHSEPVLVLLVC